MGKMVSSYLTVSMAKLDVQDDKRGIKTVEGRKRYVFFFYYFPGFLTR